ncbi:MAG: NAD(+) synthase [Pseudomonadota bacterium]
MARRAAFSKENFYNFRAHGFARVATATPAVKVADPIGNTEETLKLAHLGNQESVDLIVFPELGLSGYSNDDLFFQDALLDACEDGLERIIEESASFNAILIVGLPLRVHSYLYNVAAVVFKGALLGLAPKSYLPNYREFYEYRQFTPGTTRIADEVTFRGKSVPFGTDLLFGASDFPDFTFHVEICEDVWVPVPPSSFAALSGAHILANLSASNITVGKSDYRHALCRVHSQRCFAAYLYSAAGRGESTTDLAWDGHAMIYENGVLMAESPRFSLEPQLAIADIDLDLLRQERMRHTTFGDCAAHFQGQSVRRVSFELAPDTVSDFGLKRELDRFPYVPNDVAKLDELCFEAYNIQVAGLVKRLSASGIEKVVIGISGGLDSTQALLVAVRAFDELKLSRKNILAYTLPAFATSEHTKNSAWDLMNALGVSASEIDMEAASRQMLGDIGHPFTEGENLYDVTFENVQAGARTSVLFRLANHHNALVLGTGDLSELALGWCTYGVGDHMSHYNVNGSVSKTLIQHLIRWVAETQEPGEGASAVLFKILDTEISPELVPGDSDDGPSQRTEDFVGPYELQDFNLFYVTRHSLRPSKICFLAYHTWGDRARGYFPPHLPQERQNEYDLATIRKWLRVFLWRFFQISQFKRSAVPNGPKVASGGSLSPRGDWRAPSDSESAVWIAELDRVVPEKD